MNSRYVHIFCCFYIYFYYFKGVFFLVMVKSTMLLLLIIAGLSLTGNGLTALVNDFFWGNLLEVVSVFMLMTFFPTIYLWNLISNYRFWKYNDLDKLLKNLNSKLEKYQNDTKGLELIKKGKDFFLAFVTGVHTKFIFAYFRKDKLDKKDIEWIISKAKEKGNENILIFCTGTLTKEAKELTKDSPYSFIVEDYRNIGDFNLKRYFTAPKKVSPKNKIA